MFSLEEPQHTRFDWSFRLLGTDVRVHPFFWITILLLGGDQGNPWFSIYWVAIAFGSILIHEFGHVMAMRLVGDRGHIVLWAYGGLAISGETKYRRHYSTNVFVAAAGPAAGLALAVLTVAGAAAIGWSSRFAFSPIGIPAWSVTFPHLRSLGSNYQSYFHLYFILNTLLHLNFYWSLVNLLPIYPLDGGQIARALFEERQPDVGLRRSLQVSALTAGIVAVLGILSNQMYLMLFFAFLAVGSLQSIEAGGRRPSRRY
jgi:stage IV sporulation protein FB